MNAAINTPQTQAEARPAYVQFEMRAVVDADASMEEGRAIYKDVDFAVVRPHGTDLVVEKEVAPWLEYLGQRRDPFVRAYRQAYEQWKEMQDGPVDGMRLHDWPAATPAQIKTCLEAGIRTVEELANPNPEDVALLGPGGKALIKRAAAWLEAATDFGVLAEKNAALQTKVDELQATADSQAETIKALQDQIKELEAGAGGKPKAKKAS